MSTEPVDGRRWIDALPDEVARQRRLLSALYEAALADERWRFLELSCSFGRGAADGRSDLDVGLGGAPDQLEDLIAGLPELVGSLGDEIASLRHDLGWTQRHQRVFAQYADGTQLDVVLMAADARPGLPPGSVALLDRDGVLAHPCAPAALRATPSESVEWAFLAWVALANLDKYLERGSWWEAQDQLTQARGHAWSLWAARHDIDYPRFGLTSVLDRPEIGIPPGMADTVAGLDPGELRRAARALAAILTDVAGPSHPAAMADWVLALLER